MPPDLAATGVTLTGLPPATRFILRGRAAAIEAAGAAFGAALPRIACRAATAARDRAALWLGPDEWLLLAPPADGATLAEALERAMDGHPHSLVEVSHGQVGIEISGEDAIATLNAGCPLDLEAGFPVGMCTRTVLAKAGIVLWRIAPDSFRIEVARSHADYIWGFLEAASREFRG